MEFFDNQDDHKEVMHSVNRFKNMVENQEQYYFDCEEFLDIIEYYILRMDFDQANSVMEYAKELHPSNTGLKVMEAQVLIGLLKYKDALEIVEEVELIEPNNLDIMLVKGAVLSRLRMSDRAIQVFRRALDFAEFKDEIYHYIAAEYQKNLDYDEAIKYYKYSLKANPDNEGALFELNMCFECTTAFYDAVKFYNILIDLHPYSESIWFNLAGAYCKLEEWDKAVECYDYALVINASFASAYFNKANALASKGDYLAAIEVYKESYEYEEPTFITFGYIAECYERLKMFDEAMDYYKQALMKNEDYGEAWLGLAICMDAQGKLNEAYAAIGKAIELDDEDPDYWYTSSEIEEKLGYIDESIASMKKAISLDDTDANLFLDYLLLLNRQLDVKLVEDALEDGVERFSNNADILFFKAALRLKRGKFQSAYESFELALNIDFSKHIKVFELYPDSKSDQNILELIDLYRD